MAAYGYSYRDPNDIREDLTARLEGLEGEKGQAPASQDMSRQIGSLQQEELHLARLDDLCGSVYGVDEVMHQVRTVMEAKFVQQWRRLILESLSKRSD